MTNHAGPSADGQPPAPIPNPSNSPAGIVIEANDSRRSRFRRRVTQSPRVEDVTDNEDFADTEDYPATPANQTEPEMNAESEDDIFNLDL